MPSSAGLWYFTHPVTAYGTETEGGTGTFTVDTATTVPVIVLGGVPSVGDYLTAYSVGGAGSPSGRAVVVARRYRASRAICRPRT